MRRGERHYAPFGPHVFDGGVNWRTLFDVEEDAFDRLAFALLWHPHGGGGLSLTLADIEEMEYSRAMKWHEWSEEQREEEAEAIKNAGSGTT
jgi:hypothetical protein